MEPSLIRDALVRALGALNRNDRHLLVHDLSERCIASRLALHMQAEFTSYYVDVEYNRMGIEPKRLGLPSTCANALDANGQALVVPDIIVHRRGPEGPNPLVVELKKRSSSAGLNCDRLRVEAFVTQLGYRSGAVIECDTQAAVDSSASLAFWYIEPERPTLAPPIDLARCPECGQGFPGPLASRWHVPSQLLPNGRFAPYSQLPLCPRCDGLREPEDA